MFVLHGKHLRAGFKPATLPPTPMVAPGSAYIPFPPLQSAQLTISAGLQPVIQIGTYPIRDIVTLTLEQPVDLQVQCLLTPDYPFYPQLVEAFSRNAITKHYPLIDCRLSLGPRFDGPVPTFELLAGVPKSLSVNFSGQFATLSLSFTFPLGVFVPAVTNDAALPPYWVSPEVITRVETICNILNEFGAPLLGPSGASVSSLNLSFNTGVSLQQALPNWNEFFYLPVPTSLYGIINEGAPSYNANLTLLLPPEVETPPISGYPGSISVIIVPSAGPSFALQKARIQSMSTSISRDSAINFNLNVIGRSLLVA